MHLHNIIARHIFSKIDADCNTNFYFELQISFNFYCVIYNLNLKLYLKNINFPVLYILITYRRTTSLINNEVLVIKNTFIKHIDN